jgi:hypothetical protein
MSGAVDTYLVLLERVDRTDDDDPLHEALYDALDAAWYALTEDEMSELDRRLDSRASG